MHFVLSLFDAPVPALGALAALGASGVKNHDIVVVPPLPTAATGAVADPNHPVDPSRLTLPDGGDALVRALGAWGVWHDEALVFAEGVKRGAILVAVRTPTLSADHVRATMLRCGAVPLTAHQARWEADPALRYGWSSVGVPDIVGTQLPAPDDGPTTHRALAPDDD